jgi:hypothetical protein
VLSGASAWHWWLAVSNDWRTSGDPESIIISKTLWAVGNFSRFVRPGMLRVELKGDQHRFDPHDFDTVLGSAYLDPSSGKLVVVYINASNEVQKVRCTISGATAVTRPSDQFTPYVTSAADDLAAKPAVSISDGAELPPRSIVTFVSNER